MRRVRALPESARRLMVLAAADPTGDATLLWRAAKTLGLGAYAATGSDELLDIGSRVRFRHPLVRSAAYAAASAEDRRAAHLALAAATDIAAARQKPSTADMAASVDPERRVWHLAAAATGPDEDVAGELERLAGRRSPGRAGGRGGVPATVGRVDRRSAAAR